MELNNNDNESKRSDKQNTLSQEDYYGLMTGCLLPHLDVTNPEKDNIEDNFHNNNSPNRTKNNPEANNTKKDASRVSPDKSLNYFSRVETGSIDDFFSASKIRTEVIKLKIKSFFSEEEQNIYDQNIKTIVSLYSSLNEEYQKVIFSYFSKESDKSRRISRIIIKSLNPSKILNVLLDNHSLKSKLEVLSLPKENQGFSKMVSSEVGRNSLSERYFSDDESFYINNDDKDKNNNYFASVIFNSEKGSSKYLN